MQLADLELFPILRLSVQGISESLDLSLRFDLKLVNG